VSIRATLRRMRLSVALAASAAVITCALPALANGRFPASNQFLFSPSNPDVIWLRATYGILPSTDNGASWAYLCEDVIGLLSAGGSGYEDPALGMMANGNVIATDSLGLNVSSDMGCDWTCTGNGNSALKGQSFIDLAVFPSDASKAVALTSTYITNDSSTSDTYAQVFETTDNGATWAAVGPPIDPSVNVQTIDVPNSDPSRIYVSGTRGYGLAKTASLFMYTTASGSNGPWVEQLITPFDNTTEDSVYIAAVDPNDADLVYLRSSGLATGGQSRLYVTSDASSDAGAVFNVPQSASFDVPEAGYAIVGELQGFALSQDGTKVYVGTKESGLWMASASDLQFEQTNSKIHVECLATRPGSSNELWACSDAVSGFVAGVSTDDGATFTSKLCSVTGMTGVVACPANPSGPVGCAADGNAAAVCMDSYNTVCLLDSLDSECTPCSEEGGASSSGGGGSSSGGSSSGGATSSGAPTKAKSSSCGFSAGDSGGTGGALGGLLLTGLALVRRRGRGPR